MIISSISRLILFRNTNKSFLLLSLYNVNFSTFNKSFGFLNNNKHSTKKIIQNDDNKKLEPLFPENQQNKSKIVKNQNKIQIKNQQKNELDNDNQYDEQSIRKSKNFKEKQNKQIELFFQQTDNQKLAKINEFKQKQMIKELSILAREMLFKKQRSQVVWLSVQQAFISFLTPTQDPQKIRSISKLLYSLGKGKRATKNYETHMALLLPHASHQSFTQICVTLSRMGGMSEQFCHILQKFYWKRRQQFNVIQLLLLNYILVKNGRKIDSHLIDNLNSFPLRGIALTLKIYDRADLLTQQILKKCINPIIARKNETNVYDFKNIVNIYCKYLYLSSPELLKYFTDNYRILKRNIYDTTLQQIWQFMPQAINKNLLPINFVEDVIYSIKKLKERGMIKEKVWKSIQSKFRIIQNLEIRVKLQRL